MLKRIFILFTICVCLRIFIFFINIEKILELKRTIKNENRVYLQMIFYKLLLFKIKYKYYSE
jgi:hypothetical protein